VRATLTELNELIAKLVSTPPVSGHLASPDYTTIANMVASVQANCDTLLTGPDPINKHEAQLAAAAFLLALEKYLVQSRQDVVAAAPHTCFLDQDLLAKPSGPIAFFNDGIEKKAHSTAWTKTEFK
jgi:hypothetical protein